MYSIEIDASRTPCVVHPTGDLTIYQAAELKSGLLPLLAQHHDVEINLSRVDDIDTAGIQVLMVLKREAESCGATLRMAQHSKRVIEVFDAMNLSGAFGDPLVIPAAAR